MRWIVRNREVVDRMVANYKARIAESPGSFRELKEAFFKELLGHVDAQHYPRFQHPDYGVYSPPCKIHPSCYIGPNVVIEEDVEIGENCRIEGNNYIYADVKIGNNVTIQPGTIIGGEAFSHFKIDSKLTHLPHIGRVQIDDDVVIGSNVCIDKGLLDVTWLKKGCRIDNLVHIAHDVVIGINSLIIANTMIGGRTEIGDNCKIAPSTSLLNGLTIGNNVTTGLHACVVRNVPDGLLVYGVPAKPKDAA